LCVVPGPLFIGLLREIRTLSVAACLLLTRPAR